MAYTLNMEYKRSYTRGDLTHGGTCSLCGFATAHDADCPLTNPDVVGVTVTTVSKPRATICEACPEDDCVAGDWRACVHETLVKCCDQYAMAFGRL